MYNKNDKLIKKETNKVSSSSLEKEKIPERKKSIIYDFALKISPSVKKIAV